MTSTNLTNNKNSLGVAEDQTTKNKKAAILDFSEERSEASILYVYIISISIDTAFFSYIAEING